MRTAEELRYLILAIQRDGNRLLARELRGLGLTPSQAEVIRVLADRQPLTLAGLGELLVCETGTNPSRLVDRLVAAGLVGREQGSHDRRHVTLTLTDRGIDASVRIAEAESNLYETIDDLTEGTPVPETLATLRALASHFPAGHALDRRRQQYGDHP